MRVCVIFICNHRKADAEIFTHPLYIDFRYVLSFSGCYYDEIGLSVAPSAQIHRRTHTRKVTERLRHVADLLAGRRYLLGEHPQMVCKRENAVELRCSCLAQLLEEWVVRKIRFGSGGLTIFISCRE